MTMLAMLMMMKMMIMIVMMMMIMIMMMIVTYSVIGLKVCPIYVVLVVSEASLWRQTLLISLRSYSLVSSTTHWSCTMCLPIYPLI